MAQMLLVNPRRRRKATRKRRTVSRKRRSPSRRLAVARTTTVKRYRRNPIRRRSMGGKLGGAIETMKTGATGAAGALAVDLAMAKLPIPEQYKSGSFAPLVKGVVGIGIGMVASKVLKNRALGRDLANGAATVALYNAGREAFGPALGLSYYPSDGLMGDDWGDELDYYNAAPTFADNF